MKTETHRGASRDILYRDPFYTPCVKRRTSTRPRRPWERPPRKAKTSPQDRRRRRRSTMSGQLEVFKYKVFLRPLCCMCRRSDERRPEAFQARLDAGAGRLVDLVQSLELLGAQLAVGLDVLPVKGLCGSIRSTHVSWAPVERLGFTAAVTHQHQCSPVPRPPVRGTRSLCRCS